MLYIHSFLCDDCNHNFIKKITDLDESLVLGTDDCTLPECPKCGSTSICMYDVTEVDDGQS